MTYFVNNEGCRIEKLHSCEQLSMKGTRNCVAVSVEINVSSFKGC